MITETLAGSGVLWQIRNWRAGGDGARGASGDGCPDGDLVHVRVVEQFKAECLVKGCLEACGGFGEDVA
jgi:hypothetical protein